jgi:hypothetical protein
MGNNPEVMRNSPGMVRVGFRSPAGGRAREPDHPFLVHEGNGRPVGWPDNIGAAGAAIPVRAKTACMSVASRVENAAESRIFVNYET